MVLEVAEVRAQHDRILERYRIPRDRSAALASSV